MNGIPGDTSASELTLLELTVRPLQLGRQDVADEYELLLSYFPNLDLEPVSKEVLLGAAAVRARYRLRTPDSILLATGIRSAATAAITNDGGWKAAQGLGVVIESPLSGGIGTTPVGLICPLKSGWHR
jgi:predicted nucleic acid-binding protein